MATITESGVVSRSLGSYRDLLGERFRAAFGTNLSLDPETPQGEIIGIMAASLVELDEVVVGQSNAQSPVHSIGSQVDDLCALIGLRRRAAQHSTVTATLTGDANTVIPAGSRAATTDDDEFETTEEHTIGAGGTVDAELSAVEAGAVPARAGTLNRIVTRVPGWASITNAADATVGRTRELTSALRERLLLHPNRLQRGTQRALQSALLDAGADRVRIEENDTDGPVTRQALTIDAHGVLCIVSGGTDDAIAEAVKTKSLGASTSGSVTHDGVKFERVSEVEVKVAITTTLDAAVFPADGITTIKTNLAAYAAAEWEIGEDIVAVRLYSPANAVFGHSISALAVTDTSDNALRRLLP